jgi:hypothetical protein
MLDYTVILEKLKTIFVTLEELKPLIEEGRDVAIAELRRMIDTGDWERALAIIQLLMIDEANKAIEAKKEEKDASASTTHHDQPDVPGPER